MPPELLTMLEAGHQHHSLAKVDVWSFGCILLEILTGIPLWFRYKCRVDIKGRQIVQLGFFALTGRSYPKILRKQKEICDNLHKIVFTNCEFESFRTLLKRTLVFNPQSRATFE